MRDQVQEFPSKRNDATEKAAAQPRGAAHDGSNTGCDSVGELAITRRISAGRRLLLQRLGHLRMGLRERPVLLLQFREQAHVLDGDDGLVGERLEERDLLLSRMAGARPPRRGSPRSASSRGASAQPGSLR